MNILLTGSEDLGQHLNKFLNEQGHSNLHSRVSSDLL